jgi:hypothetical protein
MRNPCESTLNGVNGPRRPDMSVLGTEYVLPGPDMSGYSLDMSGQDRSTR